MDQTLIILNFLRSYFTIFFLAQISGLFFIEGDFNTALMTNLNRLKRTDNTYTKKESFAQFHATPGLM